MRYNYLRARGIGPFLNEVYLDLTKIEGPIVAVVGPNGAGKSTKLELFPGGLYRETPTRGSLASLATTRDAFIEIGVVNGSAYTIRHTIDAVSGKGESVVLDEDGKPLLTSSKLREFDQWAAAHLPSREVLYCSTFAPQGSGGFLELKPGDRKAVLLRTLGIERYELLAERAREKARDVKGAIATLAARIEDERARGGDVAALENELAEARDLATKADVDALAARDALRQAEVEASDAAEAARKHRQRMAESQALRGKASELDTKATEIARRLDANRAIQSDADAIRSAVERIAEIDARLAELGADIARLEGDERTEAEKAREHETAARSLREKASEVEAKASDLERRIANNRAVLADAASIRGAVARTTEIDARLAEIATIIARLEGDERAELAKVREHESAAQRAREAARAAEGRRQSAEARVAGRESVERVVAAMPDFKSACESRDAEVATIERELEAVRTLRLSGAETRISGLRGGLNKIAGGIGDAHEVAVGTLTEDERLAADAEAAPERERQLSAKLAEARRAAEEAHRALRDAETLAARLPELKAAAKDAEAASAERDQALAEAEHHEAVIAEPRARAVEIRKEAETLRTEGTELRTEKDRLAPLAAKAAPLAQADARIAELEPQLEEARTEAERLRADAERHDATAGNHRTRADELSRELFSVRGNRSDLQDEKARLAPVAFRVRELEQAGALVAELEPQLAEARKEAAKLRAEADGIAPTGEAPTTPDLAAAQRRVEEAERVSREAHGRIAVFEQRIESARAAADRLAGLEGERRAAEDDLADWNLLADSLGRDGLQALEIDAAGPELTELVNDLLRTCVGSRWTVSIETTRLSADGKRQLEGCEVRVLDTERGRDGAAETLSGGERVLVGEAVSLALSMLACRRSGVQGPTLVRDESGAALDPVNARGYVAMLRRAAEIVGASHVLFVTHVPDLQELADARVRVSDGSVEVC